MEWIDVKERIPEIGKTCLLYKTYPEDHTVNCLSIFIPVSNIIIGGLRHDGKYISQENQFCIYGIKYISHWMELPQIQNRMIMHNLHEVIREVIGRFTDLKGNLCLDDYEIEELISTLEHEIYEWIQKKKEKGYL